MKQQFSISLLPEVLDFLDSVDDDKAREKIYFNLKKSQFIRDNELFKKLNDSIWEFRTLYKGKAYRLFAFWDKTEHQHSLVLATHGIVKKTNKTPVKEIKKAEEIMKTYFKSKES